MKYLKTNLSDISNYLISLFYKTGCKYSCNRTKIGKLLSILAFKYAANGDELFYSAINKCDGIVVNILELHILMARDEYLELEYKDDQKYIDSNFCYEIPSQHYHRYKYLIENANIPSDIKAEVEAVFRNFGSYKAVDLGNILSPIVDLLPTKGYAGIDLVKVPFVINEVNENNPVIKYLKTGYINDVKGNSKVKIKIKK